MENISITKALQSLWTSAKENLCWGDVIDGSSGLRQVIYMAPSNKALTNHS